MTLKKSYTLDEATRKLESYCAYQERCHQDVVVKLRQMQMIPQAIDVIVAHLIENNYLNEERFAKSFSRGKFNIKKWGKRRIEIELKRHNISAYLIKAAIKEIGDKEYRLTLNALAEKRIAAIKDTNPLKRKRKLADYLLYRGWESHLVYEKVNELL